MAAMAEAATTVTEQVQHMDNNKITYSEVNNDVYRTMTESGRSYWVALILTVAGSIVLWGLPWAYQIYVGQGVSGLHTPAFWGIYLANFIFWIGISHSGTLLSAILFLTRTPWRRSIYRSAEAMTFFSVLTAALFVFVHMGRPWNFYWTLPYPNQRSIWINFISPLLFDVFAISTYMTSSVLFLYLGSIPDLAAIRDRMKGVRGKIYSILSLGWRGTDNEWFWLNKAYVFLAVLIVPLAVSVHSIVSWDFALSKVPGFSKTIFAPYFVLGAIYSGTAGIVTLMIILRKTMKLEKYITLNHFDKLNMLILVLSLLWTYVNVVEVFTGWYADTSFENEAMKYRMVMAPFSYFFWTMIFVNTFMPLLFCIRKARTSIFVSLIVSLAVNLGMWIERFLIIVTSLPRKFFPYMWNDYWPSWVEWTITAGSFSFFVMLFLIFVRYWPSLSIYEIKEDIGVPLTEDPHKHV